jgi:hypothetical protein
LATDERSVWDNVAVDDDPLLRNFLARVAPTHDSLLEAVAASDRGSIQACANVMATFAQSFWTALEKTPIQEHHGLNDAWAWLMMTTARHLADTAFERSDGDIEAAVSFMETSWSGLQGTRIDRTAGADELSPTLD